MTRHLTIDPTVIDPGWWKPLHPIFRRCGQRILVVTDGSLNYNPNDGFGLTEFLQTLATSGSVLSPPVISTAHRSGDPNATIAGAFNFAPNPAPAGHVPVTTANYDQIWLFGFSTSPLSSDERRVITQFMQDGGGVFATGDHSSIGAGMGANLPRVRNMREWAAVPMSTPERLDTINGPGKDPEYQFTDQSDNVPQRIYPHYEGSGATWNPHPLLRSSTGDIDVLPDHPHESECRVPPDLTLSINIPGLGNVVEYPLDPMGVRESPRVVATAISGGRYLTDFGKPPVVPRCFGAISAYNGHKVGIGRVACDATWHHFVNINLNGVGNPLRNPADFVNGKNGLYDNAGNPTPQYLQIKRYYRNLAGWLAPARIRLCRWWLDLVLERYRFPLIEEWRPLPHPCPWDPLVEAGMLVHEALDTAHGRGAATELVNDLFTGEFQEIGSRLFSASVDEKERHLISAQEMRWAVLGAVMDMVFRELPESPYQLSQKLKGFEPELAHKHFMAGARVVFAAASSHFAHAAAVTQRLAKQLHETEPEAVC